ncbi:LytR/AlgR family response regulator transcription factor [Marvinbryantia formatexigens]|uniref:LytR/AlgR family response regulator transcription factor n=1 Tax=Marvinbryantia formatexigens TaxID=168384 RepID=UPI00031B6DCA|nr:LytTR family DNA-binding domain-containing protein [Marvinbryantia formatexigens]UWO26616.1 LytTR family DNA-binding domain-containing protein [Marvinbryantia formatexigens DSM 14469]SDG47013.1 two component transcriptional regulator, LytTR family [Marvinbryantia formatexigens]
MVKIAICDDEEKAVSLHEQAVRESLHSCGIAYEIETYTQSRNLLYDIMDDGFFYDLILLDIEMPGMDGMEIVRRVKEFLPKVKIIFVTSHTEYAIDAFELAVFRYVPKSDLDARLAAAVTDAAKLIELEEGQEYTIRTLSRLEKIPYRDIFYIERDGKNASIVSAGGISKVRKSLQQVFEELNAPEFIFIDRGCIVNIIHVMKISGGMAVLKNGEQLPVSRSHLQDVKRQINQFWGAHI